MDHLREGPRGTGNGLAQAPYVGSILADLVVDGERPEDLDVLWTEKPRFPRPLMMNPLGLRTVWAVDRFNDRINGSRRNARKGSPPAA